jgi:hypothetical protein
MPHSRHFALADPVIAHLNSVVCNVTDQFILSRYVGLIAVAAVTVYELCIKDIFWRFSSRKHKVFGTFVSKHFEKINGRIRLCDIKGEYLPRFGEVYLKGFAARLDEAENLELRGSGRSIIASYNNIITWRHQFAHEGIFVSTVTYSEAVDCYALGKGVIRVLAETMTDE